jgi:hypothetical protein
VVKEERVEVAPGAPEFVPVEAVLLVVTGGIYVPSPPEGTTTTGPPLPPLLTEPVVKAASVEVSVPALFVANAWKW